jgi:capsular exopolysaccharide synthesis family protein
VFLLGLLISLVVGLMTPPVYRATVQLQLEPSSGAKVHNNGTVTELPVSLNQKEFYQTQYELLKSRALARKVIDQLNLYPNDESHAPKLAKPFFAETLATWQASITGTDVAANTPVGDYPVEEEFLQQVSIEPIENSSLVKVHYDAPNPETAKTIANEIAAKFIAMNLEQRVGSSNYAKDFVDDQIAQTKSKLDEAEAKLVQYAKDKALIISEVQQNPATDRLTQLETAVTEAEKARIAAQSAYEHPTAIVETVIANTAALVDDPATKALKDSYTKLQAEYVEKLTIYKPDYPAMLTLQQQMSVLEKQISDSSSDAKNETKAKSLTAQQEAKTKYATAQQEAKAKYLTAQQQEADLRKELEAQKGTLLAIREKALGYTTLQREVDTSRSLYEGLLQRIKEVAADIDIAKSNITIVDQAVTPYSPFKPNIQYNLGIGASSGLLLSILLLMLLTIFDDRIRNQAALETRLGLPVLGLIPRTKKQNVLTTTQWGNTPFSAAFFSLRTRLMFSGNGLPKILHITSAMSGEGTSTVCTHLAIACAQAGKKVLLIDCNLHSPSLHRLFEIGNKEGLSELLVNQQTLVRQTVMTTQIAGVYMIPAGANLPDPAGLFAGDRMHELLTWARGEFDLVILDSPAVLGNVDALILAHQARVTLLVANAEKSRGNHLENAYEQLQQAHTHVMGTTLNRVKKSSQKSGRPDVNQALRLPFLTKS